MKVIISNGHFKFILGAVAAELCKRGMLKLFITAGYPTPFIKLVDRVFKLKSKGWLRLLDRKEELPNEVVEPMWLAELLQKVGAALFTAGNPNNYGMYGWSMRIYGWFSSRLIQDTEANIYHYRAGYGRQSVAAAKRKGMITICDHSLVHPRVLDYLIENGGKLPSVSHNPEITKFWSEIEVDINQADYVIVNSDFVKNTFINRGWDSSRVFVAYTGLDDALIKSKPQRKCKFTNSNYIQFQFAGEGGQRKGLPDLLRAFQGLDDCPWKLNIVGDVHQCVLDEFGEFLRDERIKLIPFCSRHELLREMGQTDVFVFPTLAEGSARVVFMAMAMGCYIITTENSGSVVKDGLNGTLVNPGDVMGLRDAIRKVIGKGRKINDIGFINSELIEHRYTQSNYGGRIVEIYREIVAGKQYVIDVKEAP